MHRNKLIISLVVLNVLDLLLTLAWMYLRVGYEANPIMAALLNLGLPYFIGGKLFVTTAGALTFYFVEYSKMMFHTLVVLNVLYTVVMLDHLWIFSTLF